MQHKTESNYQVRSVQQCFTWSGITKTEHTEVVLISLPMVYIRSPNSIPYYTALTDYGWRRENGVLQVDWEVQANIDKAKACLEFVLAGCKCRTGCSTRRCSCKKNDRMCGPSCNCINCTNSTHTPVPSSNDTTDLEVQDLLSEPTENEYVDDSGDDLEEMREDEELTEIVNFVFGPESDEEDLA